MVRSRPEYFRRLRATLKRKGICVVCRKEPARPSQTKCEACATKQVQYILKIQRARRASGHCITCNMELGPVTMNRCPVCQERVNELIQLGRVME